MKPQMGSSFKEIEKSVVAIYYFQHIFYYEIFKVNPAISPVTSAILEINQTLEKKEPTDDTSKDVYSLLAQHVPGIIMPIVRRQTK